MGKKTYIVRFVHNDGSVETWEHRKLEDAKHHFDLFGEDDADIYREIQLMERDWSDDLADVLLEEKVLS